MALAYDDTRIRAELFHRDVHALAKKHGLIGEDTESPGVAFYLPGWRSWFSRVLGLGPINRRYTPLQVNTWGDYRQFNVTVYHESHLAIGQEIAAELEQRGYELQ